MRAYLGVQILQTQLYYFVDMWLEPQNYSTFLGFYKYPLACYVSYRAGCDVLLIYSVHLTSVGK